MPTLPPADVFIASHGRSGSTLLADLLTTPPHRLVLVEPRVAVLGSHVREQFVRAGLPTPGGEEAWDTRLNQSEDEAGERLAALFGPGLDRLERWGVKEVAPFWFLPSIRVFRPRKIVLLARNLAQASASLFVKNRAAAGTKQWRTEDWMLDRFCEAIEGLEGIARQTPEGRCRWVTYEDLVTSPDARDELSRWLGWPLDGTPGTRLDLYGRDNENERHGARITERSLSRYTPGEDAEIDAFVERMLHRCARIPFSRPDVLGLASHSAA